MPKYSPPTPREYLAADVSGDRVWIPLLLCMLLGELDAHLHRPAGTHRIQTPEEPLAERHHANEVLEQLAQVLLGPGLIEALAVAHAVWRANAERRAYHELRNAMTRRSRLNFATRDGRQPRHGGIDQKVRFLLRHRQYRANVLGRRRHVQRLEGGKDVDRPTWPIHDFRRHQPLDLRAYRIGIDGARSLRESTARKHCQYRRTGHDKSTASSQQVLYPSAGVSRSSMVATLSTLSVMVVIEAPEVRRCRPGRSWANASAGDERVGLTYMMRHRSGGLCC